MTTTTTTTITTTTKIKLHIIAAGPFITMTSNDEKIPGTELFVQPVVQTNIKEHIEVPHQ